MTRVCEDEVKGRKPVASDHSGRNLCIYVNTEAITRNITGYKDISFPVKKEMELSCLSDKYEAIEPADCRKLLRLAKK